MHWHACIVALKLSNCSRIRMKQTLIQSPNYSCDRYEPVLEFYALPTFQWSQFSVFTKSPDSRNKNGNPIMSRNHCANPAAPCEKLPLSINLWHFVTFLSLSLFVILVFCFLLSLSRSPWFSGLSALGIKPKHAHMKHKSQGPQAGRQITVATRLPVRQFVLQDAALHRRICRADGGDIIKSIKYWGRIGGAVLLI